MAPINFRSHIQSIENGEKVEDNMPELVEDNNNIQDNNIQDETEVAGKKEKIRIKAENAIELENTILKNVGKLDENLENIVSENTENIEINKETGKKKNKGDYRKEIKELEACLGIPHRGLTKLTLDELKEYLAQLLEKAANKMQNGVIEDQIDLDNKVDYKNETINLTVSDMKKEIRERKNNINNNNNNNNNNNQSSGDLVNPGLLYQTNLLFLYLIETVTVAHSDVIGTDTKGSVECLKRDKDTILMPIYEKIYRENMDVIEQYAPPMTQLLMYNASILAAQAMANMAKKKE